ncbi:MAG: endo-1,4-beta-xylanase [Thermoguttaceae bacterium]|nr:endo-1,4-beta-xylanase [Thermoguttaceae bacterium]MDW8039502.1 endo-1,4-beta-xylanase [Thermoguttaceae bacterium]
MEPLSQTFPRPNRPHSPIAQKTFCTVSALGLPRRTFLKRLAIFGGGLGWQAAAGWAAPGPGPKPTDEELLAGAEERIQRHRKGEAVVEVISAGRPVSEATVRIQQTRHRFLFGCNIFMWRPMEADRPEKPKAGQPTSARKAAPSDTELQRAYRQRFADLFNYATLGFYWWAYEPKPGQPRHEYTEQVARWCQQHGIVAKGHPLAWNWAEPRWLPENPEEVLRLQLDRIEDCLKRFAGLVDYWDVVNEAVEFDRPECRERAPRLTALWAKLGRAEFTKQCLQRARTASAKAFLLVNDYIVDPRYEKLLEQLKDREGRLPINAIGIQSHQHGGTWSNRQIWNVCQRFSRFGLPLHFTETTILSGQRGWELPREKWISTPEGEKWQAQEVVRFYTMLFSHPAVEAITWWDLSDLGAWQGAPAGLVRKDMSPKPAYEELMRLIKGQWWTRTEGKTDKAGSFAWNGFFGQYRIEAIVDGRQVEKSVELVPGQKNRFVLELPAS